MRLNPLVIIPPLITLGLLGLFLGGLFRDDPDAMPSVFVGRPAPGLTALALEDAALFERDMLDMPGVKVVNFWASWCAPCRAEHPALKEIAEKGIPVYGVNRDRTTQAAFAFLNELGDPYSAQLYDPNGRQAIDWGVYGLPETFVIDGNGEVVLRFAGPIHRVMDSTIWPAIEGAAQ